MTLNIDQEIAFLKAMTASELRARYVEVFGEQARTGHKAWLVKRIAWRLQALAEGNLSERARRRAAELANDADLGLYPPRPCQAGRKKTQVFISDLLVAEQDTNYFGSGPMDDAPSKPLDLVRLGASKTVTFPSCPPTARSFAFSQ